MEIKNQKEHDMSIIQKFINLAIKLWGKTPTNRDTEPLNLFRDKYVTNYLNMTLMHFR